MKRWRTIGAAVGISALAALSAWAIHALLSGRRGAASPFECPGCNVVLVSIDTLRADHLGCYGYDRNTSPNMDRLAGESLVFTEAISQSSWTTPAHASMMSGLDPSEHGLIYYKEPGRMDPRTPTLASMLKSEGYETIGFHGGAYVSSEFGIATGFDVYEQKSRGFEKNIEAARKWLADNGGKRFFLFLHGYDVHRPYVHSEHNSFVENETGYDITEFCTTPETRTYRSEKELRYVVAQYDAGIHYVDELLGGFFGFLEEEGLLDETVVVVTSDHGEEFFEHGLCDHKHSVYRELVHVPLVVRLPSRVSTRISRQVPASIGIFPTIARIVGAEAPADDAPLSAMLERNDLTAVVDGRSRRFARVFSETGMRLDSTQYWRGVTTDEWKMIFSSIGGRESFELFGVKGDPHERDDVYRDMASSVAPLRARLVEGLAVEGGALLPPQGRTDKVIDETLREQLEALGYVD